MKRLVALAVVILFLFAAIVPILSPTASATPTYDYKVETNDGTFTARLNAALAHANTITYVPSGTYTLTDSVYFATGTTLIGDGNATAFTSTSWHQFNITVSDVTLSSFKFTGHLQVYCFVGTSLGTKGDWTFTNVHASYITGDMSGACFWVNVGNGGATADGITFDRCTATYSKTYGFLLFGIDNAYAGVSHIKNVAFTDCTASYNGGDTVGWINDWIVGFDVVECTSVENIILTRCVANNNWCAGIHVEYGPNSQRIANIINMQFIDCVANNNGQHRIDANWPYNNHAYYTGIRGTYYGYGFKVQNFQVPAVVLIRCSGTGNLNNLLPWTTTETSMNMKVWKNTASGTASTGTWYPAGAPDSTSDLMFCCFGSNYSCNVNTYYKSARNLYWYGGSYTFSTPAPPNTVLNWMGRSWKIWNEPAYNGGPYLWSNDPSVVSVDSNGYLHVNMINRGNDVWWCPMLSDNNPTGYGTYEWVIDGIHAINANSCFAVWVYAWQTEAELDIEQAMWGGSTPWHYNVHPIKASTDFSLTTPNTHDIKCTIDWRTTGETFTMTDLSTNTVLKTWSSSIVIDALQPYPVRAYINLYPIPTDTTWKHAYFPTNGIGDSYVIKSFHYTAPGQTVLHVPHITSTAPEFGTEGVRYNYQATATNTPTSWSCTGMPSGMSINVATGLLSWNSPAIGSYPMTVTATNADGHDDQAFTLIVSSNPRPPEITSAPKTSCPLNISYTYQATATNSPTWSSTGMPDGMTINETTGFVLWYDPVVGTYPLTLTATNADGFDEQVFTLTVTDTFIPPDPPTPPPPPTIDPDTVLTMDPNPFVMPSIPEPPANETNVSAQGIGGIIDGVVGFMPIIVILGFLSVIVVTVGGVSKR